MTTSTDVDVRDEVELCYAERVIEDYTYVNPEAIDEIESDEVPVPAEVAKARAQHERHCNRRIVQVRVGGLLNRGRYDKKTHELLEPDARHRRFRSEPKRTPDMVEINGEQLPKVRDRQRIRRYDDSKIMAIWVVITPCALSETIIALLAATNANRVLSIDNFYDDVDDTVTTVVSEDEGNANDSDVIEVVGAEVEQEAGIES